HGKLYVQLCQLKNQKVKLQEVVKSEVEALQKQLDAKSKVLADYTHDVEQLQAQVNNLLAEAACSVTVPKRAGDTVQGLQAVKLYLNQDDNALATAEYLQYRAEATAKGSAVLDPLRWHLHMEVGLLDETEQGPPAKRSCTAGVAGDHMQEIAAL
ncbi:MAG: hypothetical protein ACKPKO_31860, partial [Candidatus Fonsibacter sp.]